MQQDHTRLPCLPPHRLKVALIHPRIAPNTGNIARLCVATGTELHLVRPLGFVLTDRQLRRSAMDYWPRLRLVVHDDVDRFIASAGDGPVWLLSSRAPRPLWDARATGWYSETKPEGCPMRCCCGTPTAACVSRRLRASDA